MNIQSDSIDIISIILKFKKIEQLKMHIEVGNGDCQLYLEKTNNSGLTHIVDSIDHIFEDQSLMYV